MAKSIRGTERLLLKIYKGWDDETIVHESFMIHDILGILSAMGRNDSTLIFIQNYYGTQEEKANSIKEVLSLFDNKEDVAILSWAYVSTDEFPEDKYYDQNNICQKMDGIRHNKKPIPFDEVIERESKLLEGLDFININKFIGYEYSEAYLYNNSLGREINNFINIINNKEV